MLFDLILVVFVELAVPMREQTQPPSKNPRKLTKSFSRFFSVFFFLSFFLSFFLFPPLIVLALAVIPSLAPRNRESIGS